MIFTLVFIFYFINYNINLVYNFLHITRGNRPSGPIYIIVLLEDRVFVVLGTPLLEFCERSVCITRSPRRTFVFWGQEQPGQPQKQQGQMQKQAARMRLRLQLWLRLKLSLRLKLMLGQRSESEAETSFLTLPRISKNGIERETCLKWWPGFGCLTSLLFPTLWLWLEVWEKSTEKVLVFRRLGFTRIFVISVIFREFLKIQFLSDSA